mgnify:FL=1
MKQCSKCLENKQKSAFYSCKGNSDGLQGSCKDCWKKRVTKRYTLKKDEISEERRVKYWKDVDKSREEGRKRWNSIPIERRRKYARAFSQERRSKNWTKKYQSDEKFL